MDFNLEVINDNGTLLVDSHQVAEMVERDHSSLMKNMRIQSTYLVEGGFDLNEFFIESTYIDNHVPKIIEGQVTLDGF